MLPVRRIAFGLLVASSAPALAHAGEDHGVAPGWTLTPLVTVPLLLLLVLFLVGRRRLSQRSKLPRSRTWLFLGGWFVLASSLISPLHEGGERSFTLHMIEHELIMLVATFLLAAASTGGTLAWGLPAPLRRALAGGWKAPLSALWRRLTEPVTATILQALVMWAWHAPALFNRALASEGWHVAQHLCFIFGSLIFWRAMLDIRRGSALLSALLLFLTSLVEGLLGALMALSSSPWYPAYAATGLSGIGLDPTSDQQLAGLLMWIPGGLVHGAAALVLLYYWLKTNGDNRAAAAR